MHFHSLHTFLYQISVVVEKSMKSLQNAPRTSDYRSKHNALAFAKYQVAEVLSVMDAATPQHAHQQVNEISGSGSSLNASGVGDASSLFPDDAFPDSDNVRVRGLVQVFPPLMRLFIWSITPVLSEDRAGAAAISSDVSMLSETLNHCASYLSKMVDVHNTLSATLQRQMMIASQRQMMIASQSPMGMTVTDLQKQRRGEVDVSTLATTNVEGEILQWHPYGIFRTGIPKEVVVSSKLSHLCANGPEVEETLAIVKNIEQPGHHCRQILVVLKRDSVLQGATPALQFLRCTLVWNFADGVISDILWRAEDVTEYFTTMERQTGDLKKAQDSLDDVKLELEKTKDAARGMKRLLKLQAEEIVELKCQNKRLKSSLSEHTTELQTVAAGFMNDEL